MGGDTDFWLNLKLNNPVLNSPHPLCDTHICNVFETQSELSVLSYYPFEHSLCWNILDVSDRDRQVCIVGAKQCYLPVFPTEPYRKLCLTKPLPQFVAFNRHVTQRRKDKNCEFEQNTKW